MTDTHPDTARPQDEGPRKHHGDKLEELIPGEREGREATPSTRRDDQQSTHRPSAPGTGE